MKKQSLLIFSILFLMTIFSNGCWRQKNPARGCLGPSQGIPGSGLGQDPFREKMKEMNAFAECHKRIEDGISFLFKFQNYFSKVDPNTLQCERVSSVTVPRRTSIAQCKEALEKAPQKNYPQLQKQITQNYLPVFEDLISTLEKAQSYFEQENYKDDNCKEGRILTAEIQTKYKKFLQERENFIRPFKHNKKILNTERLARLESQGGKNFSWQILNVQMPAEELVDVMVSVQPDNLDKYEAAFKQFEEKYQVFNRFAMSNQEKIAKVPLLSSMRNSLKTFYTKSKVLKRRFEEKPDSFSRQLVHELESAIRSYNTLTYSLNAYNNMPGYYDKMMEK